MRNQSNMNQLRSSDMMAKPKSTPPGVTIIALFVLSITAWNSLRTYTTITNWYVLQEFGANPYYILLTGLLWTILGILLLTKIYKRNPNGILTASAMAVAYYLFYWLDRIFFQASPAPNTIFSIFFSSITLAIFSIFLYLPATRAFFIKE